MTPSEFSRPITDRQLPSDPVAITANAEERAALAQRFGITEITDLRAIVELEPDGKAILGTGELTAAIIQSCSVSGDNFATDILEPVRLRFVEESPALASGDPEEVIEVDLSLDDRDEIEYSGETFDLGEAIAQTLGLAIDPYAEGPDADTFRAEAGIVAEGEQDGPLADLLKGLKKG